MKGMEMMSETPIQFPGEHPVGVGAQKPQETFFDGLDHWNWRLGPGQRAKGLGFCGSGRRGGLGVCLYIVRVEEADLLRLRDGEQTSIVWDDCGTGR